MTAARLLRGICFGLFILLSHSALASFKSETDSFNKVQKFITQTLIKQQGLQPGQILLVLDNDNTLLTNIKECKNIHARNCQYLGSVAWFDWQYQLLKQAPRSKVLTAHSFDGLLAVQRFLFQNTKMVVTQPELPKIMQALQKLGINVMVEAARDPWMHCVTEQQLLLNGLNFSESGLPPPKGIAGNFVPSKALCGVNITTHRIASYQNGIYTVNGQNKGQMLQCLFNLTNTAQRYRAVVFVDDKMSNINNMYDYFEHSKQLQIYAFHYTREDSSVNAFLNGPQSQQLQRIAAKKWQIIYGTLNRLLPQMLVNYPNF